MNFLRYYFVIVLSVATLTLHAQNENSTVEASVSDEDPASKSLLQQFQTLKDKSNTYQEYKVIRISNLNTFWNNVRDSIELANKDILEAHSEISAQKAEIEKLLKEYKLKEAEVQNSEYEKAHITVLGMDVLKESYKYFNAVIIFLLLILIGVLFTLYNGSKKIAQVKKREFESIDKELNDYKQRAREKEIKIKRELQTEMNRVEELNQELISLKRRTPLRPN